MYVFYWHLVGLISDWYNWLHMYIGNKITSYILATSHVLSKRNEIGEDEKTIELTSKRVPRSVKISAVSP